MSDVMTLVFGGVICIYGGSMGDLVCLRFRLVFRDCVLFDC